MAKTRYNEFTEFCLNGTKKKINGNLSMEGDEVYSYSTKIGEVNRKNKTILLNDGDFRRSMTTNRHLSAITSGYGITLKNLGWKLELVNGF